LQKFKETQDKLEESIIEITFLMFLVKRKTESQDTRLLKIQNEARVIEDEYDNRKQEVEAKLVELSKRTQAFIEKQKMETEKLNALEEQVKKDENKR
jgi:hypothetical protein